MPTSQTTFRQFCPVVRWKGAFALCLCTLGLSLFASAQQTTPPLDPKHPPHTLPIVPHNQPPAAGVTPAFAGAQEAATTLTATPQEIVLLNFVSPPHGAYPANGVIRDFAGNLYGTTNGAYSDIGGGGTNNSGLVFKLDPSGHQTVLYSFTGGADGSSPNGLILDPAGNLYGTTSYGGASGAGVVFKLGTSGKETVLYSFTGGNDGANPNNVIRDWKGNLYGTTYSGGASGAGVVFKIDTSGNETTLYTFTGGNDGSNPNINLELDSVGNIYGTTNDGGTAGFGVVFKVNPAGQETVLHTFTGGNDGAYPNGVTRDWQGNLYGTASNGGISGQGIVFKVDAAGNETILYTFSGGNDGGQPDAVVTLDLRGNIYGTTAFGGAAGLGVVYKLDPSGKQTVLQTLKRGLLGDQPDLAGVILDATGNLYGTTAFGGGGGGGVVYKLDTCGNYTVLYTFPGASQGQYPAGNGVIVGSDGLLYGTTFYGGQNGKGVVYQLNGGGQENVLYEFTLLTPQGFGQPESGVVRDSKGNLYGGTFTGQTDVGYGYGVVYKLDPAGHVSVLHNFSDGDDGAYPSGVILDSKGNLYGTGSAGGVSGAGVIFKLDASGNETVLYSFTGGADGASPNGPLVRDASGNLYGTTNSGGSSTAGVVFKVDPTGNETVLHTFSGGADGAYPYSGLILDSAGNLYGTTQIGGTYDAGVVFKLDSSNVETVLYNSLAAPMDTFPPRRSPAMRSATFMAPQSLAAPITSALSLSSTPPETKLSSTASRVG